MALALAEIDNGQFLSRFRQAHRRYRKIRIDLLDVADHGHLETQGLIRLRRIDDLEDGTLTVAAEMEILVPLTGKTGDRTLEAEMASGDLARLGVADFGGGVIDDRHGKASFANLAEHVPFRGSTQPPLGLAAPPL